jgi:hypothetical protein
MTKQPSETDPALDLLLRFTEAFAKPALGHAREELTDDQEEALLKLARGELKAEERKSLVPLLAHNECALEFIRDHLG